MELWKSDRSNKAWRNIYLASMPTSHIWHRRESSVSKEGTYSVFPKFSRPKVTPSTYLKPLYNQRLHKWHEKKNHGIYFVNSLPAEASKVQVKCLLFSLQLFSFLKLFDMHPNLTVTQRIFVQFFLIRHTGNVFCLTMKKTPLAFREQFIFPLIVSRFSEHFRDISFCWTTQRL